MTSDTDSLQELVGLVDESELETVRTRSATFRADVNDRFGIFEGESIADGSSRSDERVLRYHPTASRVVPDSNDCA